VTPARLITSYITDVGVIDDIGAHLRSTDG
jgi:hypothetical protein